MNVHAKPNGAPEAKKLTSSPSMFCRSGGLPPSPKNLYTNCKMKTMAERLFGIFDDYPEEGYEVWIGRIKKVYHICLPLTASVFGDRIPGKKSPFPWGRHWYHSLSFIT
jgi:hypothetical protein